MKQSLTPTKAANSASWLAAIIMILVPFHAFITVWLSSLFGHYTLLRLWKEFLLAAVILATAYTLLGDRKLARRLFSLGLTKLIAAYVLLLLVFSFIPLARHDVSNKAMWYGLLVDLRFLVFFLAVIVIAAKSSLLVTKWKQILLVPAILVAAFAVLQYLVLPYDFLKHFGYGPSTIRPYEAISHTTAHIRVASTLRGANPLGAYLIIPICLLAVLFFREKTQRLNKTMIGVGFLLALIFSFSRSAWIGAALGVLAIAWLSLKAHRSRKLLLSIVLGILAIGTILALGLRHNTNFQDIFLHTDHTSKVVTNSSERHGAAAKLALKDIEHHPLGSGVGSAGPQSFYNRDGPRVAENYFLQIGQEVGTIGMLLFITICALVGKMLFTMRNEPLALALFASLIGISLVNLLSHAWADDTLAYFWWGLAGITLAPILSDRQKAHGKNHKA